MAQRHATQAYTACFFQSYETSKLQPTLSPDGFVSAKCSLPLPGSDLVFELFAESKPKPLRGHRFARSCQETKRKNGVARARAEH